MKENKIFLLVLDGVGLRNFAYSNFNDLGVKKNFNIIFWNKTIFSIESLGFKEIKITSSKLHWFTEILKKTKKDASLNVFIKRTGDEVYNSYKFKFSYKNLNNSIKSILSKVLIFFLSNEKGMIFLDNMINKLERKTIYYKYCKQILETEKPKIIFATSQRHIQSVAPLLAAKDLKIPTASFIFSWDNVPKATMLVETDYYFVWSKHMKSELLFYHSNIEENQIIVTGTPQFEIHYDKENLLDKVNFFKTHSLDLDKKYICFSGDDVTTSPDDPKYLQDLANSVERLNEKKHNLGIIFRRCPVDFSSRYDEVLDKYKHIIVPIDPVWKAFSSNWDTILPTKEDGILFSNIAEHTEMVVNLGSTTLFDFLAHNKPCGYFRYNQKVQKDINWDIFKCYKYVHFRSMYSENSVIWLDNENDIDQKIEMVVDGNFKKNLNDSKKWFEIINQHPPEMASERIWNAIEEICNKEC